MALIGRTVFLGCHGVVAGTESDFREWHDREHVPERMAMPGFIRARRYAVRTTGPLILNVMELEGPDTLKSAAYRKSAESPTEWTARTLPNFRNLSRGLFAVVSSLGAADGGYVTFAGHVETPTEKPDVDRSLDSVSMRPQVVAVHLCHGELASTGAPSTGPGHCLLVETSTLDAAMHVRADLLSDNNAGGLRATGAVNVYQLETCHRHV
jgi:hypothetical protein